MQLIRVVSVLLLVKMAVSVINVPDPESLEEARLMFVEGLYNQEQARNIRLNNHFFCVNRTNINNTYGELEPLFTEFEQTNESVWTLFLQFPALAYLDPARKTALLTIVVNTLNLPGALAPNEANPPTSLDDLCIGTFEFYELTTFRESVLFHLYNRNEPLGADMVSPQFDANVRTAFQDGNNNMVVPYPNQPDVIAFNLTAAMTMLGQNDVLLPFRTTPDTADPTTLAVYLGSFPRNMTIEDLQEAGSLSDIEDMFAENPNPVNYGLEAGDYAFAVLGGFLLGILTFIILLGYCIHPFFLA